MNIFNASLFSETVDCCLRSILVALNQTMWFVFSITCFHFTSGVCFALWIIFVSLSRFSISNSRFPLLFQITCQTLELSCSSDLSLVVSLYVSVSFLCCERCFVKGFLSLSLHSSDSEGTFGTPEAESPGVVKLLSQLDNSNHTGEMAQLFGWLRALITQWHWILSGRADYQASIPFWYQLKCVCRTDWKQTRHINHLVYLFSDQIIPV